MSFSYISQEINGLLKLFLILVQAQIMLGMVRPPQMVILGQLLTVGWKAHVASCTYVE
jgi:hypothetical protein